VVLWGETAYPYGRFTRQHETDLPPNDSRRIQRGFNVPVIVGLVTRDMTGANPYAWNTAWVLDEHGRWGDRYDKNYPLMFGEVAPPGIDPEWYLDKIPSASHLNRGEGAAAIEAAGYRFGALICYEDILGGFTREVANERVNVLVNLTNDSWFGKTREQAEHLGLAVFRSVEHRKGLLRSVNAGISAYVDPTGRVIESTRVTDSDTDRYDGAEGFVVEVHLVCLKAEALRESGLGGIILRRHVHARAAVETDPVADSPAQEFGDRQSFGLANEIVQGHLNAAVDLAEFMLAGLLLLELNP
jgi:apolipoprotein N-acyltransferase